MYSVSTVQQEILLELSEQHNDSAHNEVKDTYLT